ncbi:MAG: alpha/beta hydrolase family protein [Methylomonas sp.]
MGLSADDLAGSGPQTVFSERIEVNLQGESLEIALYQPTTTQKPLPAVVFLPGLMAANDQYDSYARALASQGFVVAVRGWYSPLLSDSELAQDASLIAEWLVLTRKADSGRIGVAGHSTGGKDAVLSALRDGRFAAVVAIDPDDYGTPSVAQGPIAKLRVPLLLIGGEVGWLADSVCAPKETNYQRFSEWAPAGTIELTLRDADHVQMLDEPDRFGYGICRSGTADSRQVRVTTRRAVVEFFVQHLQGGGSMTIPPTSQAIVKVIKAPAASISTEIPSAEK